VFPSNITGKATRVTMDGRKHAKVLLDPMDKEMMDVKNEAIMHCYHKLTTHKIAIGYSKPTLYQQKLISQRKDKN
jgi:hypothetical protein